MAWTMLVAVLSGFLVAQIASLVTTIYLHRGAAHRAVTYHPALAFLMDLVLWLTTGIRRDEWVAVHLKHHAHPDEEGDPHSPILLGLWAVQLGNYFLYRKAIREPGTMDYAKHIKLSWAERHVFRFSFLGLAIGTAGLCIVLGFWTGLLAAFTHLLLYLFFLNNLVNGWCHARGYKNFEKVVAFNNRLIAWITVGEGLHNNHHHEPGNYSLRRSRPTGRFGEVDLGLLAIRALCALGLAEPRHSRDRTPA
ncbi:MAG: fatty acid desaturase [Candidatus Liptonbacteria bacterium]|nr:fatty acid desaturase [Candidatus Liptonbacteria bacterium]